MANMTSSNGKWTLTQTINQAYPSNSPKIITFNTQNKFVDQNIELKTVLDAAAATVSASKQAESPTIDNAGSVSVTGKTQITASPSTATSGINQYYMVVNATAPATTLNITKTINTAGYLSTDSQITASAATTAKTGSNYYIPITSGVAAAGTGSAAVSLYSTDGSANGVNISAAMSAGVDSEPSSGYYVAVSYNGSGNSTVTTAGWFPTGALSTASSSGTKYFAIRSSSVTPSYTLSNSFLNTYFDTGTSSDNDVIITPKYTANQTGYLASTSGNGTAGYYKIKTTSITEGLTSVSSGVATRGTATWGTGWISSGTMPAATFANSATANQTYVDISSTTQAPILITGDYLYINKGYTDNLKISLAKLVPDFDTSIYTKIAAAAHMRQGYVAYDQDGAIITGTIQDLVGGTKYATESDQTISCTGKYMTSDITIKKLTKTNYSPSNIKYGVTIKVNNGNTDIYSETGTFTSSTTVSSGQTAATAAQMLSGYSAWVNGAEVKGNIATGSGITFSGKTATAAAGYYATAATANMQLATITSGAATIDSATFTYNSANDNFSITGSKTIDVPTVSTSGYISTTEGTKNTNTASLSTSVAKIGIGASFTVGSATNSNVQTIGTPTISKHSNTNVSTPSSAVTTSKPSSGYYVAVQSGAVSKGITASASVTSDGYGTTSNYTATNSTFDVKANASSVTYVKITSAEGAVNITTPNAVTATASVSAANYVYTDTSANNGISITATGGGSALGKAQFSITTAGYAPAGTLGNEVTLSANSTTTTDTTYITGINVPQDVPFTLTSVADTALDTTSNITVTNSKYRNMVLTNSGKLTIINDSTPSNNVSSVIINALPNSGSTMTGEKTVVENGRWKTTTVEPGSSQKGPYYGAVYVSAMSAGPSASNFSLDVTNVTGGDSAVTVGTLASGYYPLTNTLGVTGIFTAGTPGYFTSGSATDSSTGSVEVGKIAAGSVTISGGLLSTTGLTITNTDLNLTISNGNNTNITDSNVMSIGATNTSTYPYYIKIDASTSAFSGSTSASVGAFTVTRTAGYVPAGTSTSPAQETSAGVAVNPISNSTYVNLKAATITPAGGELSGSNTYNDNITRADSDDYNNGLSVVGNASMSAVTYTNTAGYMPANTSAQSFVSNNSWSQTKYIKGVKLTTPSSGIRCFDITVPNGDSSTFITFHFEVDSNSNVTVTDTHTT